MQDRNATSERLRMFKITTFVLLALLFAFPGGRPIHRLRVDANFSCTHASSGHQALDVDAWYCTLPAAIPVVSPFSSHHESVVLADEYPVPTRIEVVQTLDRSPPSC